MGRKKYIKKEWSHRCLKQWLAKDIHSSQEWGSKTLWSTFNTLWAFWKSKIKSWVCSQLDRFLSSTGRSDFNAAHARGSNIRLRSRRLFLYRYPLTNKTYHLIQTLKSILNLFVKHFSERKLWNLNVNDAGTIVSTRASVSKTSLPISSFQYTGSCFPTEFPRNLNAMWKSPLNTTSRGSYLSDPEKGKTSSLKPQNPNYKFQVSPKISYKHWAA